MGGVVALLAIALLTEEATEPVAETATPDEPTAPASEATPPEPPSSPPYSLPWHLRGAVPVTALRFDHTAAVQDSASTTVSFVSASLRIVSDVAVAVRWGWVNDAPVRGTERLAFTNLGLSATYAPHISRTLRLATSGGVTLPVAEGGGNAPVASKQQAIAAGVYTRSAMDNSMFGANDLGLFLGVALAHVDRGLTLQAEATLFQLTRVQGEAKQVDASKTNSTWGLHAGYFVVPGLSIGAEVRYQIYIAPPQAVEKSPDRRDTLTAEAGIRGHIEVGSHALHPGIAYGQAIDDPMSAAGYRVVQVDLPFVF